MQLFNVLHCLLIWLCHATNALVPHAILFPQALDFTGKIGQKMESQSSPPASTIEKALLCFFNSISTTQAHWHEIEGQRGNEDDESSSLATLLAIECSDLMLSFKKQDGCQTQRGGFDVMLTNCKVSQMRRDGITWSKTDCMGDNRCCTLVCVRTNPRAHMTMAAVIVRVRKNVGVAHPKQKV